MKIYTPCWGKKHISLLENCLGRSLSWPRNNKAIENCEWIVLTAEESECAPISKILKKICPTCRITVHTGGRLIDSLHQAMVSCFKDQEPMLMATPDFIYGDGTIDTFKTLASKPGICCSIAHMRVLPGLLNHIGLEGTRFYRNPPSNSFLIRLGFKFPHISWTNSEEGCKNPMSYLGGIRWNNLGNGIYTVRHFLPSPFFCNFLEADLNVFKGTDFVHWDHTFPANLLMQGRLRYIGSSDAACMIEITDADLNVPEIAEGEEYFRNFFNHTIQRQFVSVFRSE